MTSLPADPQSRALRSRRLRLALAAAVLVGTGCAAVLGLDETTLREGDADGGGDGGGSGEEASVPDGASPDAPVDTSPLSLSPATLTLRRGGTATFTVTLTRSATTPASVSVTVGDLPAGVKATTATIGASQSTATVTLEASASATLGTAKVRAVAADGAPLAGGTATLVVAGAPGTLDTTFDGDGLALDATKGIASVFYALAVQPDGKIVAAGTIGGPGPVATGGWLLRRFNTDGSADAAFDAATVALPVDGEVRAIAIDAKGRIVCVGRSAAGIGGVSQLTVARVTSAGALDATFGVARATALEAPSGSSGLAVALGPNGEIYAAGAQLDDGGESGIVTRWREADGGRDPSWNAGQVRVVAQNRIVGVAPEGATGGVVLGGTDNTAAPSTYWLGRLQGDGGLDQGFGTFGTSTFAVSYAAKAFTRLPSGALVLVGDTQPGGGYTAGLTTPLGASIFARAYGTPAGAAFYGVAPVGDLGFVAAGHASGPNGEAKVMRILLDGGADTSFSDGGAVVLDPAGAANGYDVTLFAAALQADGRVLVAGNRSGAGAALYRIWP